MRLIQKALTPTSLAWSADFQTSITNDRFLFIDVCYAWGRNICWSKAREELVSMSFRLGRMYSAGNSVK
jgi:hypothetical protein